MKRETELELKEIMRKTDYYQDCYKTFEWLFYVYSLFEIKTVEDVFRAPRDFYNFVSNNLKLIRCSNYDENFDLDVALDNFYNMLCENMSDIYFENQLGYANLVSEVVPDSHKTRLLDVASGKVPASSIGMAKNISNVSSMDRFLLSADSLCSMNVNSINEYMTPDTKMDDFDLVVARHPCEATNTIISNCARENLNYFIHFCSCGLPQDKITREPSEFYQEELRKLDPRIKFSEIDTANKLLRFGYVLDIPQADIEGIIKSSLNISDTKKVKNLKDVYFDSMANNGRQF